MLTIIMSRSSSKLGHVDLKTRSLCQILEKPCGHSERHSFDPKFMKVHERSNFGKKNVHILEGTVLIQNS